MKIPFSKRAYRDGMRRTRRLRLIWYMLLAIGVVLALVMKENEAPVGSSALRYCLFLLFLVTPILLGLSGLKLSGYHYSKRIADTMNTLPVSEADRYNSFAAVTLSNLLLFMGTLSPLLCLVVLQSDAYAPNSLRLFTFSPSFLAGMAISMFVFDFVFVAMITFCREVSHSRGTFCAWMIAVLLIACGALPFIAYMIVTSTDFLGSPFKGYNVFHGRFEYYSLVKVLNIESAVETTDALAWIVWLVIGILFFFLGRQYNKKFSVDYLDNEAGNQTVFRLLLTIWDAIALILDIVLFAYMSKDLYFIVCSVFFPILVHVLLCLKFKQSKALKKTIPYFGLGILIAVAFLGISYLCRLEYMRVPVKADYIGMESTYYKANEDNLSFLRKRIEDMAEGNTIEYVYSGGNDSVKTYTVEIVTSNKSRTYQVLMTDEELWQILNKRDIAYYSIQEGFYDSILTEKEYKEYLQILQSEPYTYSTKLLSHGFFGGMKETGYELNIHIPDGDYAKMIRFGYVYGGVTLSPYQPRAAEYYISRAELRGGEYVKERLHLAEKREGDGSSHMLPVCFYLLDDNPFRRMVGRDVMIYQDGNGDMGIVFYWKDEEEETSLAEDKVKAGPERTMEFVRMILQYADGDGSIEDSCIIAIEDKRSNLKTDEEFFYWIDEFRGIREKKLLLSVPKEAVYQWLNAVKEECYETVQ